MEDGGLEAVVSSCGAGLAVAEEAEVEIEVVADDEDILGWDFVKFGKIAHGEAGIVIKSLRFNEDVVALFAPDSGMFLVWFPAPALYFGIKI